VQAGAERQTSVRSARNEWLAVPPRAAGKRVEGESTIVAQRAGSV
jgi:hypothetical protein